VPAVGASSASFFAVIDLAHPPLVPAETVSLAGAVGCGSRGNRARGASSARDRER
jgi:hypothetical protein